MAELNNILKKGYYPRLAEWDSIEVQDYEYLKIVQVLIGIPMVRLYRVE